MKSLHMFLLILSICFNGFSQSSAIQVELVDNSVGIADSPCHSCGYTNSNDEGLNQIFANYQLGGYEYLAPDAYLGEHGYGYFYIIYCLNEDVEQLLLELRDYDSVIKYAAEETVDWKCVNILNLTLVDENIGIQTETTSEGLVVTNDTGLNQIFQDFNVREYILYPESLGTGYSLICDCDAQELKNTLNDYNSVISDVVDVGYAMLLSAEEQESFNYIISPNPFKNGLNLQINKPVEQICLHDILGKLVYESSSIKDFENFSLTLKSGVYLLKLVTAEGESLTKKLIKA